MIDKLQYFVVLLGFILCFTVSVGFANQACYWRCWQYPDRKVYCWCFPYQANNYYQQYRKQACYQQTQTRRPSYPERVVKSVADNAVRTAVSELNWAVSDAIRKVFRK